MVRPGGEASSRYRRIKDLMRRLRDRKDCCDGHAPRPDGLRARHMTITHTFEAPRGYYSKRFWGGAALSAVSLFWLVAGTSWFEDRLGAVIVGGAGTVIFLPGTLLMLKRLLGKKPTVTLSWVGIEMHSTAAPDSSIRWNEISGLSQRFTAGHWMIRVNLVDPRDVIARAPLLWRPVMYLNKWFFGSPVFIVIAEVKRPYRFLELASAYVPCD